MSNTIVPISDPLMYQGYGPVDAKSAPVRLESELPNILLPYEGLEVIVKKDSTTGTFAKYWYKNGKWEQEPVGDSEGLAELSASTIEVINDLDELSAYTASLKTSGSLELVDHVVNAGACHYYYLPEIDLSKNSSFTINGLPASVKRMTDLNSAGISQKRLVFTYNYYGNRVFTEYEHNNQIPMAIVVYDYNEDTKKATYHTNYRKTNGGIPKKITNFILGNVLSKNWQWRERRQRKNGDKKLDVLPSYSTMQRPYVYIGESVLISRYTRCFWDDNNIHVNDYTKYFYLEKYNHITLDRTNKKVYIDLDYYTYNLNEQDHFLLKYNHSEESLVTADGQTANFRKIAKTSFSSSYRYTLELSDSIINSFDVHKLHFFVPIANEFFLGNVIFNKSRYVYGNINYVRVEDQVYNRSKANTTANVDVQIIKRCNPNEEVLVARNNMMIRPFSFDNVGRPYKYTDSAGIIRIKECESYGYYSDNASLTFEPYQDYASRNSDITEIISKALNNYEYEVLFYIDGGRHARDTGYKWRRLTTNKYGETREQGSGNGDTLNPTWFKQHLSNIISGWNHRIGGIGSPLVGSSEDVKNIRYLYVAVFKSKHRPHRMHKYGRHPEKIGTLYKITYVATYEDMANFMSNTELIWQKVATTDKAWISVRRKGYIHYPNKLR